MTPLTYGSVCSGIEAASVAWEPLGMKAAWFSEIEAFTSAVLKHHYPHVPNLGDMRYIARQVLTGLVAAPDVLVGGTPCQAFSVAGLREGLDDERGQLTMTYMRLLDAIDFIRGRSGLEPAIAVWENVPGVLSDKTNAFGCFLAGLAGEDVELVPAGKKWANAGCVFGPKRAIAWRILDAQYAGVAQRRRRVFVVASARKGFDPSKLLFEFDGVRRDSPPSRSTGKDVTGTLSARTSGGGGLGTDFDIAGGLQPVTGTLDTMRGGADENDAKDGRLIPMIAPPVTRSVERPRGDGIDPLVLCMAHGQAGAEIAEDRSPTLTCNHEAPIVYAFQPRIGRNGRGDMGDIVSALTAQAGETGKGDAAPCVAIAIPLLEIGKRTGVSTTDPRAGLGIGSDGDPMFTLQAGAQHGIAMAFQDRFRGDDGRGYGRVPPVSVEQVGTLETAKPWNVCVTGDITHTLKAEGFDASEDGTGRGQPIVPVADTLTSSWHNSNGATAGNNGGVINPILHGMRVRRLVPMECERLQGFPDGYTDVPVRMVSAANQAKARANPGDDFIDMDGVMWTRPADGPRYKALGNSMAVPCMAFLGRRVLAYLNNELGRGFL